jgi:ubiquinone/menaquinone biosynthesis C-methylase UbiE
MDDNLLNNELDEIVKRYDRRKLINKPQYDSTSVWQILTFQERERAFIKMIKFAKIKSLSDLKLIEIGCGNGNNILGFLRLGFKPENLAINELIHERFVEAKSKLPGSITMIEGNALDMNLRENSFDIVFQSMVFSSILDIQFQNKLALKMWELVKPGGGILWYDFIYNNPKNKDVTGIPLNRVTDLFPEGEIKKWKITLAPPLSRVVTEISPLFYNLFNLFPFLRTHILCWITKNY